MSQDIPNINTQAYWENRFSTNDWAEFGGAEQSKFFGSLLVDLLPGWLSQEFIHSNYSMLDIGCAEGQGTNEIKKAFPNLDITGIDFSESAIETAKTLYPHIQFQVADAESYQNLFDVIVLSNVLEHLSDPQGVLHKLLDRVNKHLIIMVPFEDTRGIQEHINFYSYASFPQKIDGADLTFFTKYDCRNLRNSYWPGHQLLVVYSKQPSPVPTPSIADLFLDNDDKYIQDEKSNYSEFLPPQEGDFQNIISKLEEEIEGKDLKISELLDKNHEISSQLENLNNKHQKDSQNLSSEYNKNVSLTLENKSLHQRLTDNIRHLDIAEKKYTESTEILLSEADKKQKAIDEAVIHLTNLKKSTLFKGIHALVRFRRQFIKGNLSQKSSFIRWLLRRDSATTSSESEYQPLNIVLKSLSREPSLQNRDLQNLTDWTDDRKVKPESLLSLEPAINSEIIRHLQHQDHIFSGDRSDPSNVIKIRNLIRESRYTGILIYPHTIHWEPLQVPQQLLRAFASNGWLCFFCEHPTVETGVTEIEPNLFSVREWDFSKAVGNTAVTVLITWLGSLAFLDQIGNKRIWYHLLDDLSIFPFYGEFYRKFHNLLIDKADWVSYVSKPLESELNSRKDAIYLPNGVNPGELNRTAYEIPQDLLPIVDKKSNGIITYFGYVSHWFDLNLLDVVSNERPDLDFVILGEVREDISRFIQKKNVHFLGLKKYEDLPLYAQHTDIFIIPFKIDSVMDRVSPIKFYEYCAYGKPVISTRMKELESYNGGAVSIVGTSDEFLERLNQLNTFELKDLAKRSLPQIAENNTWLKRMEQMQRVFAQQQRAIFNTDCYQKYDVIILSIIDYDFRFQRPQHFAESFAKDGHRVFYINVSLFKESSISEIKPNLNVVYLSKPDALSVHQYDWSDNLSEAVEHFDQLIQKFSIRDAILLVDYPNWVNIAEQIREKYGFKIVLDYMDDFTGFENPEGELVKKNTVRLLKVADGVIPSSEFLADKVRQFRNEDVQIVRNGCEFKVFNAASKSDQVVPAKPRPIVGYYGAIAHWFDAEKVVYAAKQIPEADFILIGEVSAHENLLEKQSNIFLLGEKPYEEIPSFLQTFDVALIPFDASIELIKATNPVKFYEYLSAAKSIVATEIPELSPYKDKLVYLSNDNEEFVRYIKLCLDKKDTLADAEEKVRFAKANDWSNRFVEFKTLIRQAHPMVSIVVLSFNNHKYTLASLKSIVDKTAYPNYEIVVVDNNSSDGSKDLLLDLRAAHGDIPISVILNDINSGFAAGNNLGIKASKGKYCMLLNNDTLVTRGWLTSLLKHFSKNDSIGMVGPVTNSIGNEAKILVNYRDLTELEVFADQNFNNNLNRTIDDPNVLALFATLIPRELLFDVGLIDESYGIGMFEDDDLANKIREHGKRLLIAEDSFIHHFQRVSFGQLNPEVEKELFEKNKLLFEKKWGVKWAVHSHREGVSWDTNMESTDSLRPLIE